MTLFSNMLGMTVESGVMIFYVLLFVLLITPSIYGQEIRGSFFRLVRLVFFPANTVSFPEVLLADAMTSMSKIFKDMGVTLVAVYSQYSISKIWEYHEVGMILIALLASLPFW
jgi:EXS family